MNIESLKGKVGSFKVEAKGWDKVYPKGFAATVTKKQMLELLKDPAVARVDIDQKVEIQLETANYWSGATKARAASPTGYGVTGDRDGLPYNYSKTDVVIAIVDTGIDPKHKDLTGLDNGGTSKIIGWYDALYTSGYSGCSAGIPCDDNGHGTHVASIAAGEGNDNTRYKGVAPGAALVGIKVLTSDGWGYESWIISGVNWGVSYKNTYGIKVMSLSLGGYGSSDGTDPMSVAINTAVNSGIVVTVAAGNAGPARYTIASPGAAANAITVGAIADPGYLLKYLPGVSSDGLAPPTSPEKKVIPTGAMSLSDNGFYLAPFSSRGPAANNVVKPDVVAPGVNIMAAKADYYSTGFHGGYWEMSGTSMATPFVAGVAALMLDANYTLTPAQIKSYIRGSAEDYGVTGCDIDYGCGRVRAYNAVGYAATGSIPAAVQWVPTHTRISAYQNDTTYYQLYNVGIASDSYPFAATMIQVYPRAWGYNENAGLDLDMEVYDPAYNYVAGRYGMDGQETLSIAPDVLGTHKLYIWKYVGSGYYTLDISES